MVRKWKRQSWPSIPLDSENHTMTVVPGTDVEEIFARELYEDAGRVPQPTVDWDEMSRAEQHVWRVYVREGREPIVPSWASTVDWL